MTRATRTVTGKVEELGKAKPRSNGSYKMTINKKLYKKDASIAFYVVGNRDADGISKAVKRKYKYSML